ncbi:hypothetical protein EAI_15431 [Harpegnathos saltator]|uniref:Odorant receptor n=1 Tax=Harpegnathos saltator TaxID=610380 RepID=E2BLE4_HARSA|nr:hypothetical protein EAI_15431 [Harpegnathos saltator]
MNFQSVNLINVRLNMVSGNLLPITSDNRFSLFWRMYSMLVWLLQLILRHNKLMRRFILQLENILDAGDEVMRNMVTMTMKPIMILLNIYWMIGLVSVIICQQPFSATVSVLDSLVVSFGSLFMSLKKVSVDIYMKALRGTKKTPATGKYSSGMNAWMEKELKMLCRHHNTVIHIWNAYITYLRTLRFNLSFVLKKLLSWNLNLIYLTSVIRFCFGAIQLSTVLEVDFMLGLSITLFLFVGVLQFYILCSSVQKLSDVNTEMTNMAFHENWYQFTPSIKRVFLLMALSNNLGCEITMCEKLRLSLPSFMSVK